MVSEFKLFFTLGVVQAKHLCKCIVYFAAWCYNIYTFGELSEWPKELVPKTSKPQGF